MLILTLSVLTALFVSFLCSLMEATVLSLTTSQVARMSGSHPRMAAIWRDFKGHIERPIAVILVLNTAAHTIGASVAGAQWSATYGEQGVVLFSIGFTYLMLQFTEILPKSLGVRFSQQLALVMAIPLRFLIRVLAPVLAVIHWINRPFERRGSGAHPSTLEEITALAGLARLSNQITPYQEKIIHGASRLSELSVTEVMIPVEQVTFLSTSQNLADAIVTAHLDPHTRFPICEAGDRNRILGYVNFKELIYHVRTNPEVRSMLGIIRPVHFAAPEESAAGLLRVFVGRHEHMALVRDGEGRVLGIVTLEDLVEELVGELEDEFDRLPRMLHPLSENVWMVGGGVLVAEVAQKLRLTLSDTQGTISAWMMRRLGGMPRPNDVHREAGAEFLVRRVRRGRIFEVSITRRDLGTSGAA